MTRFVIVLTVALVTFAAPLRAQSADALLAQGIRAYQQQEYPGGAWLLRRALSLQGSAALSPAETARALMYLAATELSRDQRDSAIAAAQRLQALDSRYRPDERIFGPPVVALFQDAQRSAPARSGGAGAPVATATPRGNTIAIRPVGGEDRAFRPGTGAFLLRITAPAPAEVSATLTGPDGRAIRTLFAGLVRDSIDLRWNGLDIAGNVPAPGRYLVTVSPVGRDRRAGWSLRLPLEVTRTAVDTLTLPPPPADSLYRAERGTYGRAWRSLVPGVLAGAAIVVLPGIIANGEEASSARLIIGGTVTVAGLAAFLSQRPGRTISVNSAHNRNLQERWRRDVADITRRNAERLRQSQLVIRAGAPTYSPSEAP
ncbi:MAG: hypothetical protein Q8Q14_15345 [Gemmatimonadales bacterium]|nr:hypothetical protein [Gemmatimonadales bacterium]